MTAQAYFDGDDGLDSIVPRVSTDDCFANLGVESSSETDGHDTKRRRRSRGDDRGVRVAFDEDEDSDAAYNAFKKTRSERGKQGIGGTKLDKPRKADASWVGAKPGSKTSKVGKREYAYGDDEDTSLMETTLPDYLQRRRKSWEHRMDQFKSCGLQTPPSYEDVEFSEDDQFKPLEERPNFTDGTKRSREYEDIYLPRSGGILPAPIAQWLRDYQVEGTHFLHELFVEQKGGILGDDMGLGKTIQVIAFLTAAFGKTGDKRDDKRMRKIRRLEDGRWYPRILIIAPGGLMSNWKSELSRWGWWHVFTYHGKVEDKERALAAAHKGRLEIMITTYDTYRQSQDAINGVRWDCVIADECHKIKEVTASITHAMNGINALCRIGLTGTAIQNKYEELWTLLNWTNPGRLGPLTTWKQAICVPLKIGQSHDATYAQLAKARRTAEKLVKNLLPQFFLRRMKSLIAHQLPKKSDQVVFCPLTETQALAYNNMCDSEVVQTIYSASEPCYCGSGKKQGWCCRTEVDGIKWQVSVFPMLHALRSLANHVALLIPSAEADRERHDKEIDRLRVALPDTWREVYQQRDSITCYSNQAFCGKWKILSKLLRLWHDHDDKVLVFSHSVRLLKMLNMLFKATTSYNIAYLDGSMTYEQRQQTVDEYNSDPSQFVFLISTKAGGVGLNITSANKVVVVDPNWNPSYDLQAQDRAYRIGQTRDVEVFRLVSVGTVEEIVYARQIYKQQQANIGYNASAERRYFTGVQDQKEMKGDIFGLKNLFAPLSENFRLRDIVNKTNVAETRTGVNIADLHLDASTCGDEGENALGDSNEDAAMSQLAADIIGEPAARRKAAARTAKPRDAVQAILASVGVEYTHQNAEVIGTSKIETKISSRAQKAGNAIELDQSTAFAQGGLRTDDTLQHLQVESTSFDSDEDEIDLDEIHPPATRIEYKYQPPEDVRRRQFCTMAQQFGYDEVTEFALVVEGWTQQERRNCLDKFYQDRRRRLTEAR